MSDTATSASGTAVVQQGSMCVSPQEPTTVENRSVPVAGIKKESPKSPKMRRGCNKASRQRIAPYPDRSPGNSTCTSSDESNGEYDNEENVMQKKIKRIAANKRERKRMHTVNSAFDQLRELVPTYPSNRKLSKIDTLRLACTYIQDLVSLLHNTHAIQGDDVQLQSLYPSPMGDGYMQINGGYHVKTEMAEFSAFSPYRIPQSCITTVSNQSRVCIGTNEWDKLLELKWCLVLHFCECTVYLLLLVGSLIILIAHNLLMSLKMTHAPLIYSHAGPQLNRLQYIRIGQPQSTLLPDPLLPAHRSCNETPSSNKNKQ